MDKKKEKSALDDLASVTLAPGKVTEAVVTGIKAGMSDVKHSLGATPASSKLKLEMFSKKPAKAKTKEKLPAHIRKVYITINDKKKNEPVLVQFSGEWTGSDINMAGKHLILEYNVYVRDRAIRK